MAAPKKAAKHVAKKAAKKSAADRAANDVRRAYEHLGRLETLQDLLPARVVGQVRELTGIAQQAMRDADARSAADLLRAAEHLSFAALAPQEAETMTNVSLASAITAEFDHLHRRAEEHWEESDRVLKTIYDETLDAAEKAIAKRHFRRGMELVRAADALAHVYFAGGLALAAGKSSRRLRA